MIKNIKTLTKDVKEFAKQLGVDGVGIAPVSRWKNAPPKLTPRAQLPEAESVIVVFVHAPDAGIEWGGEPNGNYSGVFQHGMRTKLDTMSLRIAKFLEARGFTSIPLPCTGWWRHRPYKDIDTSHTTFSHRHAFVAAGLGELGWHSMAMSPKYGPRLRMVSIITSARLVPDPLYEGPELCDRCGMCEKHCPGNSYSAEHLLPGEFDVVRIEDKVYHTAKVNRWRCFWGEQCHMDVKALPKEKDLDEQGIYNAMDRGVPLIGGYMATCYKYCMSAPVRYWDRGYTPGPRRKKERIEIANGEIMRRIKELAVYAGVEMLAIQPLQNEI